jgi:hypothetical protein
LELAGPNCTAIMPNTPHDTHEARPIVGTLVALVEGSMSISSPPCFGRSEALRQDDYEALRRRVQSSSTRRRLSQTRLWDAV